VILLDTNVVSELMKATPDSQVLDWSNRNTQDGLCISAITQAEIALLPDGQRRNSLAQAAETMFTEDFASAILPFDQGAATHYAVLVARRMRSGRPISTEDAQIAAIALHHGLHLATRNVRDFEAIEGLALINPWKPV
jgi:hypothetical protein